jgi:hypothetical protein
MQQNNRLSALNTSKNSPIQEKRNAQDMTSNEDVPKNKKVNTKIPEKRSQNEATTSDAAALEFKK